MILPSGMSCGNVLLRRPAISMTEFSRTMDTPSTLISAAMRGALAIGR